MKKGVSFLVIIVVIVLLITATALIMKSSQKNLSAQAVSSTCPKISQASLNLETSNCSTVLNNKISEARTSWSITKSVVSSLFLTNPQNEPIIYEVKVVEGQTTRFLVVSGQIKITNGGEQTPVLSNVVANLQRKTSGTKFSTAASAVAVKDVACRDGQGVEGAQTCFGQYLNQNGAKLTLTDLDGNDITAYLGNVPIPPSDCSNVVTMNFKAEFDIDQVQLQPGSQARVEILTTFAGAGARGKSSEAVSCTLDVNCNGIIDGDNSATCQFNEAESNNVRTVPQRTSFTIPPLVDVCPALAKADSGASSMDYSCVQSSTNYLDNIINKQYSGRIDSETISGAVSCSSDTNCSTDIVNTASISCLDNRNELIEGSPASASIQITCIKNETNENNETNKTITRGDFCTYTQGGWGAVCKGHNPGCIRDSSFASAFSSGLTIGHPSANYNSRWTSSSAIESFLPAGSTPSVLTQNLLNPLATSAGVFAGQITALTLSVRFDDLGLLNSASTTPLGDLHITSGVFAGLSIRELLALANDVVGGNVAALQPYSATISNLNDALDSINNCFDGCSTVCNFIGY